MNVIKVWSEPNPKEVGSPWIADLDGQRARGRHAEESVRNLLNAIENKRRVWDGSPEADAPAGPSK